MTKIIDVHFGEHLTLDGYGGNEQKLNDRELVLFCLNDLVTKLEMKQLSSPEVYHAKGNDIKDPGGWTGFVVIEESHVSIHTFPKRGFVSIDVYTCQSNLPVDFIVNYFKEIFKLEDVEMNFIKRGTRYPQSNLA